MRVTAAVLCLCLGLGPVAHAASTAPREGGPRVALVLGNSAYSGAWPDLAGGPLQDARLMRQTLEHLKFTVVYGENADLQQMIQALQDFRGLLERKENAGALALVYFSGHGAQVAVRNERGGEEMENFLIPVRTDLVREKDVPTKALAQAQIEATLRNAGAAARMLILEACRENALQREPRAGGAKWRGLAERVSAGMVVAYSAAQGRWAYNSGSEPGEFTSVLAEELRRSGTLTDALFRARELVIARTQKRERIPQEPTIIDDEITLPSGPATPGLREREELAYWSIIATLPVADRAAVCRDYLAKVAAQEFPGTFTVPAQACVNSAARGEPSKVAPVRTPAPPVCAECPGMVRVEPGSFLMGSPDNEPGHESDEGPQHRVTIAYAFEVSRYPITRGEWRRYVAETGRKGGPCWGFVPGGGGRRLSADYGWTNPGFPQADNHPVVCVTWAEAQAYITWLNSKSGSRYRLLTEAEYEFVSRAGSSAAYPWGSSSDAQCSHANAADLTARARISGLQAAACSDGYAYTSPVGSFTANAFGLYDTVGNVWSWTQDCYHTTYNGAPTDGSAWGTSCERRVVRGGDWESLPVWLRSAYRNNVGGAYYNVGFRVARTLP